MAIKLETDRKTALVAAIRKEGGYGKRIEDKYQVGFPDMILIPLGSPVVFFAEGKLVYHGKFSPTPRQYIELVRLASAPVMACVIGFEGDLIYAHERAKMCSIADSVLKRDDETLSQFLIRFYHERKDNE